LTIYAGKLAVNDLFDNNAYAHDPRNDFMNWAIWEGGAYDYAADQKGYTDGVAVDLNQKEWAFRFGYFLEPKFSSSGDLDTLVFQRGGYQAEIEQRYEISSRPGRLRVLGFMNRALMGSYSRALTTPDFNIAQTRKDRFKIGFVLNLEQASVKTSECSRGSATMMAATKLCRLPTLIAVAFSVFASKGATGGGDSGVPGSDSHPGGESRSPL